MSSRNLAILVGHVGKQPNLREAGTSLVCNFTLATSENWVDKNGDKQKKTEWHNIVVWNKTAAFVGEYVNVGDALYVEGAIQTRKFENKEGQERYITEIKARSVQMLKKKEPNGNQAGMTVDDIPFD